jgi:hypothetical protein
MAAMSSTEDSETTVSSFIQISKWLLLAPTHKQGTVISARLGLDTDRDCGIKIKIDEEYVGRWGAGWKKHERNNTSTLFDGGREAAVPSRLLIRGSPSRPEVVRIRSSPHGFTKPGPEIRTTETDAGSVEEPPIQLRCEETAPKICSPPSWRRTRRAHFDGPFVVEAPLGTQDRVCAGL